MQRLLPKQEVDKLRKEEERQRMEEGMRIATSVDSLREARATEEEAFEKYRMDTLTSIQAEIDEKKRENEQLAISNKSLKEERIRLETPLDVAQLWKEVHEVEDKNDSLAENLLYREITVTKRENDIKEDAKELEWQQEEVAKNDALARERLRQADAEREEAAQANIEAQSLLSKLCEQEKNQNHYYDTRKKDLSEREEALLIREEALEKETLAINREKILLADRRATLERGFEELRRKQQ